MGDRSWRITVRGLHIRMRAVDDGPNDLGHEKDMYDVSDAVISSHLRRRGRVLPAKTALARLDSYALGCGPQLLQ